MNLLTNHVKCWRCRKARASRQSKQIRKKCALDRKQWEQAEVNFHHQNENLQKQIEFLRKDADFQREAMKTKAKQHEEEIKMIEDSKTKMMNMMKNKDKEMKKLRQQLEDLE